MKKLIIKGMGERYLSDKIVKWYLENSRPLPWRATSDPYRIWLSEVILQQTRVVQGLPYYERFIGQYPTIHALANAPEQEVLRHWQGLGYYTRARNLHKCAKTVVNLHGGKFPSTFRDLLTLPGIGAYTAAAIAAFSFNEKVAVLDGNVFRVLSRIFGIETPVNSPEGRKQFQAMADELVPEAAPGLHNQAMMEFGALLCKPKAPLCHECCLRRSCVAYRSGLVDTLPVKTARKKPRKRYFFYLVIEQGNALLMKRRLAKDIWHGLFDFVLIETTKPARAENVLADSQYSSWFGGKDEVSVSRRYTHLLTHQTIQCRFIRVKTQSLLSPEDGLSLYSVDEVARLPKPALISRFLEEEKVIS